MNKVAAAVLAAAMVGSMAVPAFADDVASGEALTGETGSTNVTYTVEESYSWTVPNEVKFTADEKELTGSVTVTKCVINEGKTLKISIADSNSVDSSTDTNFVLTRYVGSSASGSTTRTYTVKKESTGLKNSSEVMSVAAGAVSTEGSHVQQLTFALNDVNNIFETAGTYKGTLTFTASIS